MSTHIYQSQESLTHRYLKEQLEKFLFKEGKYSGYLWSNSTQWLKSLVENYEIEGVSLFKEKLWLILNEVKIPPKCYCGNKLTFTDIRRGYKAKFCCIRCQMLDTNQQETRREKSMELYGVPHHLSAPEIRKMSINTFQEKYGCHPRSTKEVQDKYKATCLEKYGVENVMHSTSFFEKAQKCRNKILVMPSKIERTYQGFENIAILELLKTFNEEEILSRTNMPRIWYSNKGSNHKYYPDIFIPSENLIIEVKSEWTLKQNFEINQLKRQACLDAGYNFEFWICSDKEVLEIR